MADNENTDLQTIGDVGLETIGDIVPSLERPKNLDTNDLAGKEDIRPDEVKLPRLSIAQGLSKQLVPGEGVYIRGLVIGEMFNNVTSDIYGNGPLTVVPVKRLVTRIEFDPNNKGVPLDRNVPAGDPRLEWEKDGLGPGKDRPPRATEYVEFISYLLRKGKAPEPIVVSIKTTNKFQRTAADLWTTFIAMRPSAIYTGLYTIESKIEKGKNKDGQETMFGVFVIKNAGFVPSDTPQGQKLIAMAKDLNAAFKTKTLVTDRDDPDAFEPQKYDAAADAVAQAEHDANRDTSKM